MSMSTRSLFWNDLHRRRGSLPRPGGVSGPEALWTEVLLPLESDFDRATLFSSTWLYCARDVAGTALNADVASDSDGRDLESVQGDDCAVGCKVFKMTDDCGDWSAPR